jgi:hypothetical protein
MSDNDRKKSPVENRSQNLGDALRSEAMRERPPFSDHLHQRILASTTKRIEPVARAAAVRGWHGLWRYIAAAAVVLAVAGASLWWQVDGFRVSSGKTVASDPLLPSAETDDSGQTPPVDVARGRQAATELDQLGHDVRVAAGLVADQIPLDLLALDEPR